MALKTEISPDSSPSCEIILKINGDLRHSLILELRPIDSVIKSKNNENETKNKNLRHFFGQYLYK